MKTSKQVALKALKIHRLIREFTNDIENSTPAAKDAYRAFLGGNEYDWSKALLQFEEALKIKIK